MKVTKLLFLSYELSNKLSGYGNGQRIEIIHTKSIATGDKSNNTKIVLPTHEGASLKTPLCFFISSLTSFLTFCILITILLKL